MYYHILHVVSVELWLNLIGTGSSCADVRNIFLFLLSSA